MYTYRQLTPEQQAALVEERLARGYPAHAPPHPIRNATFYLLTATCYEHKAHLATPARRQQVRNELFAQFTQASMEILAWVVLPNHYHLLVHVSDFDLLGELFRAVHGPTARQWNQEDMALGRKVWYRFHDRAIRSEAHYYTTLNYIHYNPVKHGWATSPYDWPESSVAWYTTHYGRDWLRDLWVRYPVKDYGKGWDENPINTNVVGAEAP